MSFADCCRDAAVVLAADGGACLAPSYLLHHEEGVHGEHRLELSATDWVKVTFALPAGQQPAATLLWFVDQVPGADSGSWYRDVAATGEDTTPWRLVVNGHAIRHRQRVAALLTGGWDRCAIPAKYLRPGANEIVFAHHGWLYVDPGAGGRSLRSFDGGQSWHADAFGPRRDLAGECLVRLRLHGSPAAGTLVSPVLDLTDLAPGGEVAPLLDLRRCQVKARQAAPSGTRIDFALRSGPTPTFDPATWTPWLPGRQLARPGRFVQWRATLRTRRQEATPVLHAVELSVTAQPLAVPACRVVSWDRPAWALSSYPFRWLSPHPKAERLVHQYRLDEVIARADHELDQLCLLRDWCYKQWSGWQRRDYPWCPSWDPLEILDTVKNNWGYGMCTHWAALFAGCAAALGFPARILVIDHHCLNEVWVDSLGKWIVMDCAGNNNMVWELDGELLNALDIHQALRTGRAAELRTRVWRPHWQVPPPEAIGETGLAYGNKTYLCQPGDLARNIYCRFGIFLRNDHGIAPQPGEDQHGHQNYHWNGYLWYTDEADPRYPEYSLQTQRAADLYWTVNRVRVYLQATAQAETLEVRLAHTTPNCSHCEASHDGGATWARVGDCFAWALAPGANRLGVRTVTSFGRVTPATWVEVRR